MLHKLISNSYPTAVNNNHSNDCVADYFLSGPKKETVKTSAKITELIHNDFKAFFRNRML